MKPFLKVHNGIIGRFPLIIKEDITTSQAAWEVLLNAIKEIDNKVYQFLINSPDGTLRVIGPKKRKKGNLIIVSSPFPPLFKHLLFTLPKYFKSKVEKDDFLTEVISINELFGKPGQYYIVSDEVVNLTKAVKDFKAYIGLDVSPRYIPIDFKRKKGKYYYLFNIMTPETVALVKFLRYSGVGENRCCSNSDIEIYSLGE